MDALTNLIENIPPWQRRLDDLNGQITRRQAELAALGSAHAKRPSLRSLRNRGSSESLKPKDDAPLHDDLDHIPSPPADKQQASVRDRLSKASPPSPQDPKPLILHRQAHEAVKAAHSDAHPPQAKEAVELSSLMTADQQLLHPYRTRSMIIVYYDSYVQGFFDDLVRFVSSSRNMMRKARMAAKVAHMKRLAELDTAPDHDTDGDKRCKPAVLPSLRYMSTRRSGPVAKRLMKQGSANGESQPADVFDYLDQSLEFVQSTCEHGAHQFLRDGDCEQEINKIQARLNELLVKAQAEVDRIKPQSPSHGEEVGSFDGVGDTGPRLNGRGASSSPPAPQANEASAKPSSRALSGVSAAGCGKASISHESGKGHVIEVDNLSDAGEAMESLVPQLHFRSTRCMRSRVA